MPVTLKDLAAALGLSVPTVSKVMNGKGTVSEDTRKKILQTAKELNYSPNTYARNLQAKETKTIGLILPNVTNPYFGGLLQALEDECQSVGYTLLVGVSNWKDSRSMSQIDAMLSNRVAGLVFAMDIEKSVLDRCSALGVTAISLDQYEQDALPNWVSIDNYNAARELTQYLIDNGHKEIACFFDNGKHNNCTGSMRFGGFCKAMQMNGLVTKSDFTVDAGYLYETAKQAAKKLISGKTMPTAIVCHNNYVAVAVYEELTTAGYKVPNDVSVACFDAIVPNNVIAKQFTSIMQPIEQFARVCVERIISANVYDDNRFNVVLPHTFVPGDTVKIIK